MCRVINDFVMLLVASNRAVQCRCSFRCTKGKSQVASCPVQLKQYLQKYGRKRKREIRK